MLSKDEIELRRAGLKATYPDNGGCHESIDALCDLALVGRSVQEGLKDAREVAARIIDLCTFPKTEADETMAAQEIAKYAAASALKQKGEVVWEGKGCIGTLPDRGGLFFSAAGLQSLEGTHHVTISLPQQEQE